MSNYGKAVLGIVLVFILGFFSGVICSSIVAQHRLQDALRHPMVAAIAAMEKRLTRNLNLDPSQKLQVHDYFQENLHQRQQLQRQVQPQVQAVNRETVQQISALLRPDQLDLFRKNIDEMHKNFGKGALNVGEDSPATPGTPTSGAAPNSGAAPAPGTP